MKERGGGHAKVVHEPSCRPHLSAPWPALVAPSPVTTTGVETNMTAAGWRRSARWHAQAVQLSIAVGAATATVAPSTLSMEYQ